MNIQFVIEDEGHAEQIGSYDTLSLAIDEIHRISKIPWNLPPHIAPCSNWENCGRDYYIYEYDTSCVPWKKLNIIPALEVRKSSVVIKV